MKLNYDNVTKLIKWLVTLVVSAFPLTGYVYSTVVPVWAGAPFFTLVASLVALAFVFLAFRGSSQASCARKGKWLCAVGTVLLLAYLFLNRLCIFEKDDARVVTGFFLTEEAKTRVANKQARSFARSDLLESFGYEHGEQIWIDIRWIDLAITGTFCISFPMLAAGFFCFVLPDLKPK